MEEASLDDSYKMQSLKAILKSKYPMPLIFVDPVDTKSDEWMKIIWKNRKIEGIAIRNSQETLNESFEEIDVTKPIVNNMFTMIWNSKRQRITHSIITYHMINDGDMARNSRLHKAVTSSLEKKIIPLANRTCRYLDHKSAVYEFNILKEVGFTGIVLRNPNLIELTNKIFK
ncbi:unnamed protein product [Caenorhabditis bovis]|uniref:Uncharacterized protein n=1 Tax=Caenorhabditis bovis TaxID=2654633 RepID=A0A8S1EGI1_9PELO|nr:unnamed protein product [Caenorhabditis bovis]